MIKIPERFGFYAVLTNPLKGYEYITNLLVEMGFPFVQLRMKDSTEAQVEQTAQKMKKITEGTQTKLIINDLAEVAARVGADGLHIGQDDISYEKAREIVGAHCIIGISTHSPSQTIEACKLNPDYIGIGPVFPTPTKKNPDPVIGIEGMKAMLAVATVPAVCIGGIDLNNLPEVLRAGAENFCMVRQFTQSQDPKKVLEEMQGIYSNVFPSVT
ncbi:thiamine phosphate synthase [Chitinispirillales bacterium ANBcel5]|uniref:thiamine phosphate synthase n=1 Tax=Cellulosispirillum alkaliphilum TaxID=3039283 RepID=UPI002A5125F1|nr:thiamine phosphate synthase [Chitinispirillales bacterium ANBcel5]